MVLLLFKNVCGRDPYFVFTPKNSVAFGRVASMQLVVWPGHEEFLVPCNRANNTVFTLAWQRESAVGHPVGLLPLETFAAVAMVW